MNIHIVSLVCSHNSSYSKLLARAFSTNEAAHLYALTHNNTICAAADAHDKYENKLSVWQDQNPYPDGAYAEYTTSREAYRAQEHDRMWAELAPETNPFDIADDNSSELDHLVAVWEEEHKYLHWNTVQENWRQRMLSYMSSLPEYIAYTKAIAPLRERFPDCKHYSPNYMRFVVEECEMEE